MCVYRLKTELAKKARAGPIPNICSATNARSYARIGSKRKSAAKLERDCRRATSIGGNRTLIEDDLFRAKLSEAELNVDRLEMTVFRILSVIAAGGTPGNESSILKIMATETAQQITELYVEGRGE